MGDDHDYYSDQCAGCRWAEWRGGCLSKLTADDGSDLDAANKGRCTHFEAGEPQGRQPQPGDYLSVVVPLDDYSDLRARLAAAEAALAAAQAELAQARADLRVMAGLAWYGIDRRFAFSATTIGDAVVNGVDDAEDAVQGMPDADVLAAVRRALGMA